MKLTSVAALAATAVFASSLVNAQGPIVNIDRNRHPHLGAAQDFSRQAFAQLAGAQADWDGNGHVQKAMNLLIDVNNELAAAVQGR